MLGKLMLESPVLPTVRILPPDEWHRLKDFGPFKQAQTLPDPVYASVLVAELDGEIVGSWMATTIVLLEGLEIVPAHRKHPGIVRRLLFGMIDHLRGIGAKTAITVTQDAAVGRLARHAGFVDLPGSLHLLVLKEGE